MTFMLFGPKNECGELWGDPEGLGDVNEVCLLKGNCFKEYNNGEKKAIAVVERNRSYW